jgi:hypothetical protein
MNATPAAATEKSQRQAQKVDANQIDNAVSMKFKGALKMITFRRGAPLNGESGACSYN